MVTQTGASSKPTVDTPATRFLDRSGIQYRVFIHTKKIETLIDAANQRGQDPQQIIRSIVFKITEDQFIMVLAGGPDQIEWKNLRRLLGINRMTMASPAEVQDITGYIPGTVNPFGLQQNIRILIDDAILSQPEVSLGSGQPGSALIMRPNELVKALPGAEIIHIDKSPVKY
jgi:Cys-tRNA(Pro) deacylase